MRSNPKSPSNLIPEALSPPLIGSALSNRGRPILEPAGTGSVRHRGNFQQLLSEALYTLPLPKPCHANPIHVHKVLVFYCELIASGKPHKNRLQTWTHKTCYDRYFKDLNLRRVKVTIPKVSLAENQSVCQTSVLDFYKCNLKFFICSGTLRGSWRCCDCIL